MRPDARRYFTDMARLVASRSTCVRRAVGCVLVDRRNHVLATGYNGVPAGAPHCNEPSIAAGKGPVDRFRILDFPNACAGAKSRSGTNLDACLAVHAEQNAMLQCRDAYAIAVAYVTAFPCPSCIKLLLNTNCHEIVYLEPYSNDDALNQWIRSGRVARIYDGEPPMIQRDLVRLFGDDDKDGLNEWRVAIACVCLNLCSARVARGVVMRILSEWPHPAVMAKAGPDLMRYLNPLGLTVSRAKSIRGISDLWNQVPLQDLPGIGPYALESIAVFCRGSLIGPYVDRKVNAWVAWKRRTMGLDAL